MTARADLTHALADLNHALDMQERLLKQWTDIPLPRSESASALALERAMFGMAVAIEALERRVKIEAEACT